MRVLGVQNCGVESFGLYEKHLLKLGIDFTALPAFEGRPLPSWREFDVIFVGGTPIPAYEIAGHPFLVVESQYLESAISAGKLCVGICFGAQLLARLLGAEVRKAEQNEIGIYEVKLAPAGRVDPVLGGFPPRFPVFQWHGDAFDVPAAGELLVTGDTCRNQMFRCGSVIGVLFHLEVTASDARSWAGAYADELVAFGKDIDELCEEARRHDVQLSDLAKRFVENLIRLAATPEVV
jgi:GMP synthase (glutamine-hydrolysing)